MLLDNPAWHSLTGSRHAHFATRAGGAARYPATVSPITGLEDPERPDLVSLAGLFAPGEGIAIITTGPLPSHEGWTAAHIGPLGQMAFFGSSIDAPPLAPVLGKADVPDMLALTAATQPGPFASETYKMGRYHGLRSPDGRLMAMVGERLAPEGFTEVSAVCTDPDFRGRGLAGALVRSMTARIVSEGRVPFLHAYLHNPAVKLYEQLGYSVRRVMNLSFLKREG